MKINRSILIALGAVIMIAAWFAFNSALGDVSAPPPAQSSDAQDESVTVIAMSRTAEPHQIIYSLYGRTEPNREVAVKAETAGLVVSTPISEGQTIRRGTVICRQDIDARQAIVDQALAQLKTRELEYTAAKTLVEKGYRSQTQAATALAALDGARASVKQAQIELDNVNMRAPFSGIFEQQMAEVGDYLGPGQPCGLLVELDPLVISSELTETQIKDIKPGQNANVSLATGETITGKVRFVEARADPSTRTFRAEVIVDNPNGELKAGVTATVRFNAGITLAQHIPAQILGLDDQGRVGVRYLDDNNVVKFAEVVTIDEDPKGIWVTGLPESTRVITKGQEYVAIGSQVNVRADETAL